MTSSLTERAANDDQQIEVGWRPFLRRNRRYLQALATLLVIALFGLAIFHLTSEVQYGDVVQALADTSWTSVAAAVFFTALSFSRSPSTMSARLITSGASCPMPMSR